MAFCGKCNISLASHRDFEPYPASAKMPRGFSSLLAQRNFDFAQDDRLIVCFVLPVCFKQKAIKVFSANPIAKRYNLWYNKCAKLTKY